MGFFKPDIILESGVSKGRSTEILARAQLFFNIQHHYAFDVDNKHEAHVRQKLKPYQTNYIIQNSIKGFINIQRDNPIAKVVAIIDGPKADAPFKDTIKILAKFKYLQAIGSHDCCPESKTPAVFSKICSGLFPKKNIIFTNPEINTSISLLNSYIEKDIVTKVGEKKSKDLINRSNYIGLCA